MIAIKLSINLLGAALARLNNRRRIATFFSKKLAHLPMLTCDACDSGVNHSKSTFVIPSLNFGVSSFMSTAGGLGLTKCKGKQKELWTPEHPLKLTGKDLYSALEMAEGGGFPWSSRRRKNSRSTNDRDNKENTMNEDIERDLLRVVVSDSEDFVPEDVKSTSSVACSCDSDFQDDGQASSDASSNGKNCPNLIDLDPEARRREQIQRFRRMASTVGKVTRRKHTKPKMRPPDEFCGYERDENGLGFYGRCLQEAKRARQKGEIAAKNRRVQNESRMPQRRRPLSMMSLRPHNDEDMSDRRRKRFSFSWGLRSGPPDTNLENVSGGVTENGENFEQPTSSRQVPREKGQSATSYEERCRQRKEKARLKAAQHRFEYFLISDIVSITNCPWYWGKINKFQAEKVRKYLELNSLQYNNRIPQ